MIQGATAVLEVYSIESPFSQPRNMVLGQVLSAIIGVALNKGFGRLPEPQYDALRWLAGALSCATSTAVMALTGTVHPPGGATALLAVTDSSVAEIGWAFVPLVMLNCGVMLAIALLINNIQRKFPIYWWTPGEVGSFWARRRPEGEEEEDLAADGCSEKEGQGGKHAPDCNSSGAAVGHVPYDVGCRVMLTKEGVSVPPQFELLPEERECLKGLCRRLCMIREGS